MKSSLQYPKFFHIGCLKTATTTIQQYLEQTGLFQVLRTRFWNTNLYMTDKYPPLNPKLISIEHDENIILELNNKSSSFCGLDEAAMRISKSQPNSQVIITIREQRELLVSAYKHHIYTSHEYYKDFEDFLNSKRGKAYLKMIDYGLVLRTLEKYFDHSNIHVFLYEDLKEDFGEFMNKYLNLFGVQYDQTLIPQKANQSKSNAEVSRKNKINYIRKQLPFDGKLAGKFSSALIKSVSIFTKNIDLDLPNWQDKKFDSLSTEFSESNKSISKVLNLDLCKKGYL